MDKSGYAICDGHMYKKVPEAMFTYVYCSNVNDFLLFTLSNSEVSIFVSAHTLSDCVFFTYMYFH